jgi:hypothetical protein
MSRIGEVAPSLHGTIPSPAAYSFSLGGNYVLKLLLFCLLLLVCWPLALAALVLYPLIWLILLPFRLVGIVVGGVFELIAALFYLPARAIRSI